VALLVKSKIVFFFFTHMFENKTQSYSIVIEIEIVFVFYLDNDAAVEWQHVDLDPAMPKIDWSKEKQSCKAAFLALACSSNFEW
jgi:hypothetical protein